MPSTHLSLHDHVIFCTKGRRRIITETWRAELHAYIGGIIRDMGGVARTIGGPGDHVHIPLGLKATHTLADPVRQVKRGSSAWIHQHGVRKFAWQEGYGAFSIGISGVKDTTKYIQSQEEHHRKMTFKEEVAMFLKKHGMEFVEQDLE